MWDSEKVYSNVINDFSVRIFYDYSESHQNIGSGILVKVDENTCYLATAKHNFKLKEDKKYWDVDIEELKRNIQNIHISNDNTSIVCTVDKLLFDNDKYDLLIFSITNWSKDIMKLPIIKIDGSLNLKNMNCCFYGYPDSQGTPSGILSYEGHLNKEEEKYIFRLDRTKSVKSDSLDGFSGSGIFIELKGAYYLVGIFTAFENNHSFYFGIDLCLILDEVNKNLDVPIEMINNHIIKSNKIENEVYIEEFKLYINKNLITFGEYSAFCKDVGKEEPNHYFKGEEDKKDFPVVNISWNDAISYCKWLTEKDENFYYRLPTVREWESIAKKNMPNENYDEYIWHKSSTNQIHIVGTKKAGELGIYDMYGNIHEWCKDSDENNEEKKISKGGSYKFSLKYLLDIKKSVSFRRDRNDIKDLGFRTIKEKKKEPKLKIKRDLPDEQIIFRKKMQIDLKAHLEKINSDLEFYSEILCNTKEFETMKNCLKNYLKISESAKK